MLAPLLSSQGTAKIIHYAAFVWEIFARHRAQDRASHRHSGHVSSCAGRRGQWTPQSLRRVLPGNFRPGSKVTHAPLDAEVLLTLNDHFQAPVFSEEIEVR